MFNSHLFFHCLQYYLMSRHKYGYGIHSPFLYSLIRKCFLAKDQLFVLPEVEQLYRQLRKDNGIIPVLDLGAGSKKMTASKRKISDIARYSVMPLKYRVLLRKIITYFNPAKILELGTSLGITALYLTVDTATELTTVEGDKRIAALAQRNFDLFADRSRIELVNASFEEFIEEGKYFSYDLILVDGNHTYQATLSYFEKISSKNISGSAVWIFDDIYWSEGMTDAWKAIIQKPEVTLSLDLCRLGIVFTDQNLSKQHFVIRY